LSLHMSRGAQRCPAPRCLRKTTLCPNRRAVIRHERRQPRVLTSGSLTPRTPTVMLYIIALVLVALWIAGFATSFTIHGLIHILLVAAVILVVIEIVRTVTQRRG